VMRRLSPLLPHWKQKSVPSTRQVHYWCQLSSSRIYFTDGWRPSFKLW